MLPNDFVVSQERLEPFFDAAGHVDEGTVHTWLDGAFEADAADRVARHVAGCDACGALVAEARGLVASSSRILGGLDNEPAGVVPAVDVARTAARMVTPTARVTWNRTWVLRAAAALFVVVGGSVVLRNGVQDGEPSGVASIANESATVAPTVPSPDAAPAPAMTPVAPAPTTAPSAAAPAVAVMTKAARRALAAAPTPAPAAAVGAVATAEPAPGSPAAKSNAVPVLPIADVASREEEAAPRPVVLTGSVRDAGTQQPIADANIMLSRDGAFNTGVLGTLTSATGAFSLTLPSVSSGSTLFVQVRRIGYGVQRHTLTANRDTLTLNVALSASPMGLTSVVVSTDATSKRREGGSIATVSPTAPSTANFTRSAPSREMPPRGVRPMSREQYDRIEDNPFLGVRNNPLSTFSIDVDRASYTNVRRFLTNGQRPPKDAVRIEEFINYFPYSLPAPRGNDPVSISSDVMAAPWQPKHQLVRVALQATRIETANLPPNNLVFLIDVSGSMNDWNKLPLVKQALRLLVDQLRPQDRVAIVAYAGAAGLVLPSTSGDEKVRILEALDRLDAGGSTAGGVGIELAYRTAREHFLDKGNNRVILATDGDFNVGPSSDSELERLVEIRRREGTYLTVLGFGTGNYQASKMEKLAKVGNGNAAYVDNLAEARKVLVEEMGATLLTVANDVKVQVEFNPATVQAYRLIGYENRLLATEDFNDDAKDAGDIGAGHQVTALYEVVPVGVQGTVTIRGRDSLRYVAPDRSMQSAATASSGELLFVKLRYKQPGQTTSRLMTHAVAARVNSRPSADTRFAAAVASFGMLLRDSEYKGNSSAAQILEQIRAALGDDVGGYRAEFVQLVERWRSLGITAGERR